MLSAIAALMALAGVVLAGLAAYVARRRGSSTGLSLAVVLVSVAWWGLAYALELAATDVAVKSRWGDLKYVGVCVLAPAWLVFVLQYTGRGRTISRRLVALLAVEPVVVLAVLANPRTHDLVRYYPPGAAGQELPVVSTGPVFWAHMVYANVMLLAATVIFVVTMVGLARTYRRMAVVLVVAALLPWVANLLHNFEVGWFAGLDLTPFAFIVTGGVLVWGVFRERLVNLTPLARGLVVDSMSDGVVVADVFGRVVDVNPAAAAIFGRQRSELVGVLLKELVPRAGAAALQEAGVVPPQAVAGVPLECQGRVFDLRTECLSDRAGRPAGELVVMRDVTEQVHAEHRLRELLAERSRVANALQASLVPKALPTVAGIDIGCRYEPAGDGHEIGGDFFDVFPLGPQHWGVVLGDVCGKGAAAAAVTAFARYTLRTLARADTAPSDTLTELNARLLVEGSVESYCTVVYGVARPSGDRLKVSLSLAGHHPPLVVDRSGRVQPVGRFGTALGLIDAAEFHDAAIDLGPEEVLCLFTDGLVEARRGREMFDSDRVAAVLGECSGRTADEIAGALVAAARRFHGKRLDDDLAILVLRTTGEKESMR